MSKKLHILGLESSCDDSSAAIITSDPEILSNIVISQNEHHEIFQGVVPEIAARLHLSNLELAIKQALDQAKLTFDDIDAIAATCGPGLIGGVIVSTMFGKAIASSLSKPFIAVNHLEGHALTAKLTDNIDYPYLLLLVSGGHCQFIIIEALGKYKIIGNSLDDAVGEAFDKVAKMMDCGFPGGPIIEKLALEGDGLKFNFPKPLINSRDCNMSFSGLKTAVKLTIDNLGNLSDQDKKDISASFQAVVAEILLSKTKEAIKIYEQNHSNKIFVIAGGVASNQYLRYKLQNHLNDIGYQFVAPPINLCTDNAAMIAFAGLERLKNGIVNDMGFRPRARWSLEEVSN